MNVDSMPNRARYERLAAPLLVSLSFVLLYRNVIGKLVSDWMVDENYSHGFLIVPLSVYFVWVKRNQLVQAERRQSGIGLLLILASLLVLTAGVLGSELFLTRVSMLGVIAGSVLYLLGWRQLRILALPIGFLLLMIPVPAIIFNQVAFPLQLLASRFGEMTLRALNIPVLREGNIITLANTSLEVAEACSGIRSLISLLTLGIVYGYFLEPRIWMRLVLAAATIPVAIFANGVRVAGTGVAAHYYGEQAAQGFFHSFSGWLVFLVAFLSLYLLHRVMVTATRQFGGGHP